MAKKRANGEGNIRKRDGVGWEARYYDAKGKRHSVYGKSQGEVRKKLAEALAMVGVGTDDEADDLTVSQWLEIWRRDFLGNVKPGTAINYEMTLRVHVIPALGEIPLAELKTPPIQRLYNRKLAEGLSPKSIKNLHGCLHKALDIAVRIGYIQKNPSSACILPRVTQAEIHPLDTPDLGKLMESMKGHEYEALIMVAIFTGMRSGELLGLTWDCVDFENGLIRITKQLIQPRVKGGKFQYGTLKNDKPRTLTPAQFVMDVLQEHKTKQLAQKQAAGCDWNDGGFPNLVFTHPDGSHLSQPTVWKILQKILANAGLEAHRFHDLRHTYVVNAFRAGDDVKTVQQNAGHYSAAFTLDRYAHVTETMHRESANRMQSFFEALRKNEKAAQKNPGEDGELPALVPV